MTKQGGKLAISGIPEGVVSQMLQAYMLWRF